jgi:hypothetical protein
MRSEAPCSASFEACARQTERPRPSRIAYCAPSADSKSRGAMGMGLWVVRISMYRMPFQAYEF